MRRFQRKKKTTVVTQPTYPPRLWWDNDSKQLVWITDQQTTTPKSPEHLALLAEDHPYVLVSPGTDQFPARVTALETLGANRVKIALAAFDVRQGKSLQSVFGSTLAKTTEAERVIPRQALDQYDVPLARLQLAVFHNLPDADPLRAFESTWMGEFHRFWGLPINRAAVELWAHVGDMYNWLAPPQHSPPDLSRAIEIMEVQPRDGEICFNLPKNMSPLEFLFLGSMRVKRPSPSNTWPIGTVARRILERRQHRGYFPAAWADVGENDVERALDQRVHDPARPLADPRSWLWRALLRSSLKEVNFAYVEAMVAFILSRLVHPELFPPASPLFDEPARLYWDAHRANDSLSPNCNT